MKDKWNFNFTIFLHVDDLSQIPALLNHLAKRIKNSETEGDVNYCAGIYEFRKVPKIDEDIYDDPALIHAMEIENTLD